ncbi:MFS transporter [Natronospirillum operosum]|uniref:MFS transporter n=1 Tax=Natronospirillum operosum TaxID=2759953 RepID=A0A4Z0WH50_9GAMM|nr:sugar efflux transporter [Natronospirillum operosum]TGG95277.1 MFS transporter [Natronospirillum operosum]
MTTSTPHSQTSSETAYGNPDQPDAAPHWTALWFEPQRLRLLILALLLGLAGAGVFPVLSTHLAIGLGISPLWIGVFFALNTLSGVLISQSLAKASDQGLRRVRILWVSVTVSLFGSLGLAYITQYGWLLLCGMIWFGLSSTAQPQLFAMAREAVQEKDAALFQSVLRACFSASWIIGPPLAYLMFEWVGFTRLMWIVAAMFALCLPLLPGLPDGRAILGSSPAEAPTSRRIKWLALMMMAVFAANTMYIVYMPLYVRETLGIGGIVPGLLMGLAAGLEIPIMIGGGAMAHRWPLLRPLWIAVAGGAVFYTGIFLFESVTMLALLQIFNGVLIGLAAGVGISVFQRLMPRRLGMASTLYVNAIKVGSLVGAGLGGVVAQFAGYSMVFLANVVLMGIAALALWQCTRTE